MEYVGTDRILSIIDRELGEANSFTEDDLIEWVGEAMGFLSVFPILEEKVRFLTVKDFKATIPQGLVHILQLAKLDKQEYMELFTKSEEKPKEDKCGCEASEEETGCPKVDDYLPLTYTTWVRKCEEIGGFTPIRLSNHNFFKTLVCKEKNYEKIYQAANDEYSIIGTSNPELLFSFKDGIVALSYASIATDKDTGYPLIPDQSDFISAVTYYIKWKIAEAMTWRGREGYSQLLQYARGEWLRYAKQAKNWAKMPKTLDEYQNGMEMQYNLIPDLRQYYQAFATNTLRQRWSRR